MISIIINIILLCVVGVLTFCICSVVFDISQYKQARAVYDEVRGRAVSTSDEGSTLNFFESDRLVDFSVLETINPGICSWIYVPGTNIDYPVVQANDNDYYLYRDVHGTSSAGGSIFMDYACSADLTDRKTIIYGHNMKDGSMFHDLHKMRQDLNFAEKHTWLYIYMDNDYMMQYELLCTKSTTYRDEYIYGEPEGSAGELAKMIVSEADHVYNDVTGENLLVLSTCIKGDKRFVAVYQATPVLIESISE